MAVQLSDEVREKLEPTDGPAPWRGSRLLVVTIALLVAIVSVGVLINVTGPLVPRISTTDTWSASFVYSKSTVSLVNRYQAKPTTHVSQTFTITNDSAFPLAIIQVDAVQPGVHVDRVYLDGSEIGPRNKEAKPYIVAAGRTVTAKINYNIVDCTKVTAAVQPIPVLVERWFGVQSIDIVRPPLRPYRDGGWAVGKQGDPKAVQWQRFLADTVCDIPYPDGLTWPYR